MSTTFGDFNQTDRPSLRGEPAWEIATLYPLQGTWSEAEYLALPSNRMMELNDGCLEILPMPTYFHELIVEFLYDLLRSFVRERALGKVMRAPLPIRLWEGQMREPDVLFLSPERLVPLAKSGNRAQPDGADLVMEVVNPGKQNRDRDLDVKGMEYARARISEYWIVDPEVSTITVLTLVGEAYQVAGIYDVTQSARSMLPSGFSVAVKTVFEAGEADSV